MTKVSDLLKSYRLLPRKRFGQNFLSDQRIISGIIDKSGVTADDVVIEIGPGLGILTEGLLNRGARVFAIEIDRDLIGILQQRFRDRDNLEIINRDALKISYREISEKFGRSLKVISNLPYNISTPIIFKLLEERGAFSMFLLMLQKEVAERIISRPGTKEYGVLSIFVQLFADVKIELDVPPSSFYPKPKVYSSVVRFDILQKPRVEIDDLDFFKTVVKASFGQRRKTILNGLKCLKLNPQQLKNALELSGIKPQTRGETLGLKEFAILSNNLKKMA